MMKMVVIEDELRLCHGIAFHIPWEKHGLEVVGVAYDGESGIRLIKEKNPDIVITDIRMPNLSGLEMIQELYKENGNLKFIIISGYDDFEYAQKAMSMGVTNYIVKPTGEENIINEVNKVKEEIIKETRNKQRLDLLEQKWSENLPRLQEQFFQHWLSQQYTGEEILEQAKTLQLPILTNQYYIIAIFSIDEHSKEMETSQHIYDFSVLRCINEYEDAKNFQAFTAPHGSTAVIFWSDKAEGKNAFIQSTNQLINEWLLHVRRSLNISVSAGIGNCIKTKEKVRISYEQANSALLSRDYFGYNVAISYEEEMSKKELFITEPNLEKKLEYGLESLNSEKTIEILEAYLNEKNSETTDLNLKQENAYYLTTFFIRYIQRKGWFVQRVLGHSTMWLYNEEKGQTNKPLFYRFKDIVERIIIYASKRQHASRNHIIQKILNKVDERLYEEISLQELADEVFVNSSYLSRLFKREIGQSFSNYITERKMLEAKNLLYNGLKIYDVSEKLAYRDVSYFTKVFRKYWNVTPREMSIQRD